MRRAVVLIALVLVYAVPVLAQEVTPEPTPTVEIIDGSTPASPLVVTVPDTTNDLYDLISLIIMIGVPAVVAIREIIQTENVTDAFVGFLHSITENQDLTRRLQYQYLTANPKQKAIVELFLELGDFITELTPTEKDDFVQHWTDYVRGVRAQREAQASKGK
jgi:hypothetical protein